MVNSQLLPIDVANTFNQGSRIVSVLSVIGMERKYGKHKMDLKCIAKNSVGEDEAERSIVVYC